MPFQPIEQHGAIGDMRTLALVDSEGTLDFLCYPEFDSPSVFAALLDEKKGGSFSIGPELDCHRVKQLYLPDTNILITRFLHDDGIAELTDFMSIRGVDQKSQIIRMVQCVRGKIAFDASCAPAFDYARGETRARDDDDAIVFENDGGNRLRLRASVPLSVEKNAGAAHFVLERGERAVFVLEDAEEPRVARGDRIFEEVHAHFLEAIRYWQSWAAQSQYQGRWREMVTRSALVLKLLTSRREGSILAAPTFGLPELVGGERNWDYRYTWLRDSSFSIYALIRLGYEEEARAFQKWLHRRVSDDADTGPLQPMYRVDGSKELHETTLDHLSGYRGSKPVRIGNGAHHQLQLDIYGELMDAIYLASKYGNPVDYDAWQDVLHVVDWVTAHWQDDDEGIWEVRSGRKSFLHSRVMCWVALDRAVRLALKRSLPGPLGKWAQTRDAIFTDIHTNFWNEELGAFVREKQGNTLDASCLLMPLMRFISPVDPRWLSTLDAIGRELAEEPLVYRYDTARDRDGLRGGEGSFTACSFWYIECLARAGKVKKARLLFDKMLGYANHVGLFSEETGVNGAHLGNFPQAFTHLALISAAYAVNAAIKGPNREVPWR